jgi:hypothetical protein
VEVLTIPATNGNPILSQPLQAGVNYIIEASGIYYVGSGFYADAEWSNHPYGPWREQQPPDYYTQDPHGFDIFINNQDIDWYGFANNKFTLHTYSPDHVYRYYCTGDGQPLVFHIFDQYYGDNSGSLTVTITAIIGDGDNNGKVDVSDLSILATNYGRNLLSQDVSTTEWLSNGDYNLDGIVNISDLSILAANYGTGSSDTITWADAYAQAFGTATDSADETSNDSTAAEEENTTSSVCSSLGLSLVASLALAGLLLIKLDE